MPWTPQTYLVACLPAWLTACAMSVPPSTDAALIQRTVISMGTSLTVSAGGPGAGPAVELVVQAVHDADQRWSSWRTDSLLTRIHASDPGTEVPIDGAFRSGWQLARRWSKRTGGSFDPAIGSLLSCWGIHHHGKATPPSQADLSRARSAAGTRCFRIGNGMITRCHADAKIAEGGFVKGLALDTAIAAAVDAFPGLQQVTLDFGGQLAWWYRPDPHGSTGQAVRSLVAHPVERSRAIASIAHGPLGSLATSGNSERGIRIDGRVHRPLRRIRQFSGGDHLVAEGGMGYAQAGLYLVEGKDLVCRFHTGEISIKRFSLKNIECTTSLIPLIDTSEDTSNDRPILRSSYLLGP